MILRRPGSTAKRPRRFRTSGSRRREVRFLKGRLISWITTASLVGVYLQASGWSHLLSRGLFDGGGGGS